MNDLFVSQAEAANRFVIHGRPIERITPFLTVVRFELSAIELRIQIRKRTHITWAKIEKWNALCIGERNRCNSLKGTQILTSQEMIKRTREVRMDSFTRKLHFLAVQ
jgi:hypothetical protein